ncbi:MAG: hypothetical protein QM811_22735 [Pirellulales bacterium]
MTNPARTIVATAMIGVLSIGIAILCVFTIGETLSSEYAPVIGCASAVPIVLLAAWLCFFPPSGIPNTPIGLALIVCGTICFIAAIGLQWYLSALNGENNRMLAELGAENFRRGMLNFNMTFADYPKSVHISGYFAFLIGATCIAAGIRIGTGNRVSSGADSTPNSDKPLI